MKERMSHSTIKERNEAWTSDDASLEAYLASRPEAQTEAEKELYEQIIAEETKAKAEAANAKKIEVAASNTEEEAVGVVKYEDNRLKADFDYDDLSREERADLASEAVKAGELSTALEAMSRMSMPELVELGRDLKENNLPHELVTSSLHAHFQEKANRGEIAEEKVAGYVDRAEKLITGERDEVKVSIFSDEEKAAARAPYASILAAKKEAARLDELEPTVPTTIEPDAPEPTDPTEKAPAADDENQPTDPEQKDDADDTAANLGIPAGENAPITQENIVTAANTEPKSDEQALKNSEFIARAQLDTYKAQLADLEGVMNIDPRRLPADKKAELLFAYEKLREFGSDLTKSFTLLENQGLGDVSDDLKGLGKSAELIESRLSSLGASGGEITTASGTQELQPAGIEPTAESEPGELLEVYKVYSTHKGLASKVEELQAEDAVGESYDLQAIEKLLANMNTAQVYAEQILSQDDLTDEIKGAAYAMKQFIEDNRAYLEGLKSKAELQDEPIEVDQDDITGALVGVAAVAKVAHEGNKVDNEPVATAPEADTNDADMSKIFDDFGNDIADADPDATDSNPISNYDLINFGDTAETGQDLLTRRQRVSRKIGNAARKGFGYGPSR